MEFERYLKFVEKEDAGHEYPRIIVVGPGATQTVIDYLELRPDGDYLRIAKRNFPLRSLTSDAELPCIAIAYNLLPISERVKRARFSVFISTEFNGVQRMEDLTLDPEHILAFGKLEKMLVGHNSGIIRSVGGSKWLKLTD